MFKALFFYVRENLAEKFSFPVACIMKFLSVQILTENALFFLLESPASETTVNIVLTMTYFLI